MGDRSMKACLDEMLVDLRAMLSISTTIRGNAEEWYSEGADLERACLPLDRAEAAKLARAWGYIEGAADAVDMTVSELLDTFELSFCGRGDPARPRRLVQKPGPMPGRPRRGGHPVNIQDTIDNLAAEVSGGKSLDEVIDTYVDTATFEIHTAILDEIGEVDLSNPCPDLSAGWTRIRAQLAYNALYRAVAAALKES